MSFLAPSTHQAMQRYRWPGYKKQLLGELQRQQNNAQFCDVLLKTEGISVPTHSCILAALSPFLCQKLSASPSPPSGQKRELRLQAVKAQTLLKIVGLLYSGEVEVTGSAEQNDLLSAARQFGITDLVEGQKNGEVGEGEPQKSCFGSCRERNESGKMQDAQVQAEGAGWRNTVSPIEKRSCVSTGRRNVKADQKTTGCSNTHSVQTEHPTPGPEPSVAKHLDCSISLQSQSVTLDKHFSFAPCPHISCVHSGAQSDGESTSDRSSGSVTNPTPTSSLSSNVMTFSISLNDDANSTTPQEDGTYQQSSEIGDSIQVLAKEGAGLKGRTTNGKTAVNRENAEQPSHRDEMRGEEKGNSTEIRHARANVGIKSLAKMRQMQQMMETETTQISIKVKLRRRTNAEVWEVVSKQDTDEALSVLTSLKQDGSSHKRLQTDLSEPPPSCVQPGPAHKPEPPTIQPATTNSPERPPRPNTPSDSQLLSSDCLDGGLESVSLPQPPGPAEECDEQMEKLLEDIMMGLNILPNLDGDCKKSHCLQPNHDGAPAICQVPVTEEERPQSRMHAAFSTVGLPGYYQEFGTQIGHASTDTAQNQPSCSSLSSVQPAAVLIQQQQQHSPRYHSSVTSMGQRDGTSHQGMPLSKTLNCPYPEALSGQRLLTTFTYFPAFQEPPSQDNILEIFPLMNGNEAQSLHSLPCMDDLRLPQCLSPLEPSTSPAKRPSTLNSSTNQSGNIQPQSSVHGRPWLSVNMGSLQFPLSAITHGANRSESLPLDSNQQQQKHLELHPQSGESRAATCSGQEVEERGAISDGHQNVAKLKSDLRKIKKDVKCKQDDTKGDAAVPKRRRKKRPGSPQEASSPLEYKHMKVSDETKGQINLSVCLVSLSSNNVLAKEREIAAGLNMPDTFVGKTNELSTITESLREKTRGPEDLNTNQMRIRTRGFLKRTLETTSSSSIESTVLQPVVRSAPIVNKEGVPKRGRGRPRKIRVEEMPLESALSLTVADKKSHDVKREPQNDSLLKEESEKTRKRKKRIRNRSKVEAVPLMALSVEADHNSDVTGRRLGATKRMVSLKEFQKLIKRQHSKTRKSKESQDKETSETAGVVEREEGKTCGSRLEELTNGTEMDTAQPQNRGGVKEHHAFLDVTVDENHNQIVNKSSAECDESQQDETNVPTGNETRLLGDESLPVVSFDVLGEEAELAAETEQPLKSPDEAQTARDGVSDKTKPTAIHDGGSSHSDVHLPQEDEMPSVHNLNLQTPERNSPPVSDAGGFGRSTGCDQEEEEVEVDVLLWSPDKAPQTKDCENGLDNMAIIPEEEEEEEEDVNEIDVTGDEAE
ncbi:uncharacterized protein LOC142948583 isoform X2 [Anarhichas minor]|uniref:uncharacterized protein LOC142948583 isoform X2 n=1 Tax=Anarhichas minor TaxID=65739 RepID=UPI003F73C6D3